MSELHVRVLCTHGNLPETCAVRPSVEPCEVQRESIRFIPRGDYESRQEHDCIMCEILGHSDFQR